MFTKPSRPLTEAKAYTDQHLTAPTFDGGTSLMTGVETDTGKWKLGDGVTAYNDLPYQPTRLELDAKLNTADLDTQPAGLLHTPGSELAASANTAVDVGRVVDLVDLLPQRLDDLLDLGGEFGAAPALCLGAFGCPALAPPSVGRVAADRGDGDEGEDELGGLLGEVPQAALHGWVLRGLPQGCEG